MMPTLDSAVEGLVDAIWFNQGQVCCAGSRLFVQEGVAAIFHKKLKARMDKLRVGSLMDKSVDLGAIVDPKQLESISQNVEEGLKEGGKHYVSACELPENGCFYPPTLITEVDPACQLMQEEIFGPVLVGTTFRTPAEAVALANNTRYGLAASIWTENINLALDLAPKSFAALPGLIPPINSMHPPVLAADGKVDLGVKADGRTLQPIKRRSIHQSDEPIEIISAKDGTSEPSEPGIDRLPKLFIGGKTNQTGQLLLLSHLSTTGKQMGLLKQGNQKDIWNAVEAANAVRGVGQINCSSQGPNPLLLG